jgi:predicted N-acetyltransferase YhbS
MCAEWLARGETADDVPLVREIVLAAFETAEEADLVDALRQDEAWIDGLSWVAVNADGRVGGHALLTRCHLGKTPALCLAPVSVSPEFQKTGAGSAVIRSGLAAAKALGERFVTVLGHPDYYPRFGFVRASTAGIKLSIEVPDEAMMAMSLDGTPLPSGIVRYAKPFGIS